MAERELSMDSKNLPGSLKAAILIQSMGKEASQEMLNRLGPGEKELIQSHLSQMGPIPQDLAENVAEEFIALAGHGSAGSCPKNRLYLMLKISVTRFCCGVPDT